MPAIEKPAHWLDILPALPVANAVPVVRVEYPTLADMRRVVHRTVRLGSAPTVDSQTLIERIDLDDPQGFGYALRYALRNGAVSLSRETYLGMLDRWLSRDNPTTDADRLALAQALAEVMS